MIEAGEFVLRHGSQLFGGACAVALAASLLLDRRNRISARRSLLYSLCSFLAALVVEYLALPLTVLFTTPAPVLDVLLLKSPGVAAIFVALGYAFLILAACRWIGMQPSHIEGAESDPPPAPSQRRGNKF